MKFYPELVNNDPIYAEFTVEFKRNEMAQGVLNPDTMPYARPDFGFNDYMSFDEIDFNAGMNGWRKFLDCFSLVPKYERVKNYIEFIHDKKIQKLRAEIPESALLKFKTQHKNLLGGVKGNKFANLELLRQVELNRKMVVPREQAPVEAPTKDEVHVLGLKEEINMLAKELDFNKDFLRRMRR